MTFDQEIETDPLHNGFGSLQILNEEILSPESGFTLRTRKDMIIITYVQEGMMIHIGPLEKPDFMMAKEFHWANVTSSSKQYAFNASESEDAHIFQCGFHDCKEDALKPGGMKKLFTHAERHGVLKLIASSDGRESSLSIQQDIQMYSTFIQKGNHIIHEISPTRSTWLHVVKGHVLLNDLNLQTGDGVGFSDERSVSFTAKMPTEILLFDLCQRIPQEIKAEMKDKLQTADIR